MNGMKPSGVEWTGDIPEEWNMQRLQWHIRAINQSNDSLKTTQVLSLTNTDGVIPYEERGSQGNKAKLDFSGYKLAFPNTLVVNSMNVLIGSVGLSEYFGCVSPVYYVFEAYDDTDIRFINYLFQTKRFQKELRRYANGILEIRLRVSEGDILRRKVPIPSLREQREIADCIDGLMNQINQALTIIQQQTDTLQRYRASVIHEAVTRGLDPSVEMKPSGVDWIGDIPVTWHLGRAKDCLRICNGREVESDCGEVPVYGSGGTFKWTDRPLCSSPSILFGRKGTIDRPLYVTEPFWTVDTMFYSVLKNDDCLKYLFYAAMCFDYGYYRSGSTLPSMTQFDLGSIKIPRQDVTEQQEIADYLDEHCSVIDSIIDTKQKQLDVLKRRRSSLIFEYVTGKRRVG